jgi:DNA-binding transcriptional LysR family regulator
MHLVHTQQTMLIDLNLLLALDALLEEASVTGAARRLHLSQPAMSRTLARIREATGDPILVRTGRSMTVSPRARVLREEVAALVKRARVVLSPEGELVPSTLERTFTIRCHDAVLASFGTALLGRVQKEAPGVSLRFLAEGTSDLDDLRQGRVDLHIGSPVVRAQGLSSEQVAHDTLVVALRREHAFARGKLTIERFARALHVLVSRRGRLRDPLDDALASRGLSRRVVTAAPTSAVALSFVRDANFVATIAERACGPLVRSMGLVVRALPLPVAPIELVQSWPTHLDDRAHRWLRGLTRELLR